MSKTKTDAKKKKTTKKKKPAKKTEEAASTEEQQQPVQPQEAPYVIHAQYVRDQSFENPDAFQALQDTQSAPEMDINIGMDARKIEDAPIENMYEVALNMRAEAKHGEKSVFIAELQYGVAVSINGEVPEEGHHPLLFIEIPRLAFPYARHILSSMTVQGGYPPLLVNPVDFHQLYLQRFGAEIQAAREEFKEDLREDVEEAVKDS